MSKITSPILLDSTGQEINETLKGIRDALTARALIDDNITSANHTWSSQKIVKSLMMEEAVEGVASVSFEGMPATPITLETTITKAPIQVEITLANNDGDVQEIEYYVPLNGIYHWDTGLFIMEDGTETRLASHYLGAYDGINTLNVSNVDTIKATYKTISKQGSADYEIINGGSAKEEA